MLPDDDDPLLDPTEYMSIFGLLEHLTWTRPEIRFVVNQICQYTHAPTTSHLVAAKRVLRCIKGNLDHGIFFKKGFTTIQVFTDADRAGSPSDRKSISGYRVFFGVNPVSFSAKKQPTVSVLLQRLSTGLWILQQLKLCGFVTCSKIFMCLSDSPTISCDNKSSIVNYASSMDRATDIFTKGLAPPRFEFLKSKLKVLSVFQLAGGS
ncbi:uncharacterized protein LOC113295051 [Papaver somniferum]|uniref:uncharacterized protein LOC113295051 n=1 Tax=Papaver somniferum TaxID=3469 RepID=UPI000E6FBACC|nr:uncharacterized protein LOC113295051 [Papaver somniferum]